MNEHQYRISKARIKYPLTKTILLNPIVCVMVDEFGNELPDSKIINTIEVEKFLVRLEMAYDREINENENGRN
jgi:hypothetical protein